MICGNGMEQIGLGFLGQILLILWEIMARRGFLLLPINLLQGGDLQGFEID
jgi:hypothetical protein